MTPVPPQAALGCSGTCFGCWCPTRAPPSTPPSPPRSANTSRRASARARAATRYWSDWERWEGLGEALGGALGGTGGSLGVTGGQGSSGGHQRVIGGSPKGHYGHQRVTVATTLGATQAPTALSCGNWAWSGAGSSVRVTPAGQTVSGHSLSAAGHALAPLLHLDARLRHHCGQLLPQLDFLPAAHQPARLF